MTTFRLAVRNCLRHRTRSCITICAIAFGCTAIIFVGGFFEDLLYKMRESYIKGQTGHLQIYRQGFFEKGRAAPFDYLIEDPGQITQLIRELPDVASVARRLSFSALLSTGDTTISCLAQGIEPDQEPTVVLTESDRGRRDRPLLDGSVIEAGAPLQATAPFTAVLGRGLAGAIAATPGTPLILVSHTTGGAINALDLTVQGIFFTSSKVFDDHVLRLPLGTAQQLLQTSAVDSLVIVLHRTETTPRVKEQLLRLFQDRGLPLELKTWEDLSDFYVKTRDLFGRMFSVLKLVIAIIVVLSIYNTMNMAVLERTTEIGTMMALGVKRRGILWLFLCEGAALGAMGGLVGIGLGTATTLGAHLIGIPMPPPPGATMEWMSQPMIIPSVLIFAFCLSVVTAMLSSWHPAYRASRLEIAEALRHV